MRLLLESYRRLPGGQLLSGYHNHNYVLRLHNPLAWMMRVDPGTLGMFRTRIDTLHVVPRLWRNEGQILQAILNNPRLQVPRHLRSFGNSSLLEFRDGETLSQEFPHGEPVSEDVISCLADTLTAIAGVPPEDLPDRPAHWPSDDDTTGFLSRLIDHSEIQVYERYRSYFAGLFSDLGITGHAVSRFRGLADQLKPRPLCLVHTDLHRDNFVLLRHGDGTPNLMVLDWELALFGDPLHELATHLVRMGYDDDQRKLMTELWHDRMAEQDPRMLNGFDEDLKTYIAFERSQSIYADTMRAALTLPREVDAIDDPALTTAAGLVCRALRSGSPATGQQAPPTEEDAAAALLNWHTSTTAMPNA